MFFLFIFGFCIVFKVSLNSNAAEDDLCSAINENCEYEEPYTPQTISKLPSCSSFNAGRAFAVFATLFSILSLIGQLIVCCRIRHGRFTLKLLMLATAVCGVIGFVLMYNWSEDNCPSSYSCSRGRTFWFFTGTCAVIIIVFLVNLKVSSKPHRTAEIDLGDNDEEEEQGDY